MTAGKAMRMRRAMALFMAGAMLLAADAAFAQNTNKELSINLKARSLVIGPKILLKEICVIRTGDKSIQQKIGAVQLGKAPPPGESKELTLSFIKLQLRQAGLQKYLDNVSGPKVIRVTTAHEEISKAVLEDAVTDYVARHAPAGDLKIELNRVPEKLYVPQTEYRLEVKPAGAFSGRGYQAFRISVIEKTGGEELATFAVAATIRLFQEVAVAKKRIPRHLQLSDDALAFEYREVSRCAGDPILRSAWPEKNMRSKVVIEPGKVIESGMVEETPLVERGQVVRLIVAAGNVEIATTGRAQNSGQLAADVKVRPLNNNKILQGTVAGADLIRVVL